ncbi:MAG: DUF5688 family protein [Lachnospiraceae bacterium]
MNYQQFVEQIENKVKKCVRESTIVSLHTVIKNNGKERKGLVLVEDGINISPTIYLEEYYDLFQCGKSVEYITEQILNLYKKVKFNHSFEVKFMQSFDKVKELLAFKIINYEKNKQMLEEIPHVKFLDFAIVFYVLLELNTGGSVTMLVRNVHLNMWKVSKDAVYEAAKENTEDLLPVEFKPIEMVVEELFHRSSKKSLDENDNIMYVLTNEARNYGASCILYDQMLVTIGERLNENFYILPSSIHEVIIVPESKSPSRRNLDDMIQEINTIQLEEEEVLSNHAYYYSIKSKRILY